MMSNWTLFFTMVGLAVATAQLFRLVDIIEYPSRHPVWMAVWGSRFRINWRSLACDFLEDLRWMFWRS